MQTLHNKGRRQKGIKLLYGNKQTIRAQESVKRDTVQSRTWKIGKKDIPFHKRDTTVTRE